MFYFTCCPSPVGRLLLASDGMNLTGLWIKNQKYYADTLPADAMENDDLPVFKKTEDWLVRYFQGQKPKTEELPLVPYGGKFRQSVWKILCEIPYGQTITYGNIARKITEISGKRASAQAVGGAVGHNPVSIIIPCHRVVGARGSLTGYAAGLDVKIKLLALEGINMSGFFSPQKTTAL